MLKWQLRNMKYKGHHKWVLNNSVSPENEFPSICMVKRAQGREKLKPQLSYSKHNPNQYQVSKMLPIYQQLFQKSSV